MKFRLISKDRRIEFFSSKWHPLSNQYLSPFHVEGIFLNKLLKIF